MLSREEAKNLKYRAATNKLDNQSIGMHDLIRIHDSIIDQIYDEFEALLKQVDNNERIADIVEEYINRIPSRGNKEIIRRGRNGTERVKMRDLPRHIRSKTELGNDYSAALIKMMAEHMIDRTKETKPAQQIAVMLFSDWRENRNALLAHNNMYPNSTLEIPADMVLANSERLYKKAYKLFKDSLC